MLILGVILFLLGLFLAVKLLLWLGVALLVVGLVFNFAPTDGPRRRYW